MRFFFASVLLVLLSTQMRAQENNLVPNGGFETHLACPSSEAFSNLMTFCTPNWNDPNAASSDYFNSCATNPFWIPTDNVFGSQVPNEGEAFIGMYCFALHQPELRDYAQTRLTQPLQAGVRYKVSFQVCLAELSLYSISSLGIHLSAHPLNQNDYWVIDVEPQIQNPAGNIIADTSGWVLITDTFASRAGGGEEWLTIGNFNYAADSDTFAFQPPNPDMGGSYFSYYYIDDVSVIALDSVPSGVGIDPVVQEFDFKVYPNPADATLYINYELDVTEQGTVSLYGITGNLINRLPLSSQANKMELDLGAVSAGVYVIHLEVNGLRKVSQRISVIRP